MEARGGWKRMGSKERIGEAGGSEKRTGEAGELGEAEWEPGEEEGSGEQLETNPCNARIEMQCIVF